MGCSCPYSSQQGSNPTPSHPLLAEWSTLQDRSFLKDSGCHEGRSGFPSKADTAVESQTQPWFVKEEMGDQPGLTEILTQSEMFPLPSVSEQPSLDSWEQLWADPGERNPGNTQNHRHTLAEATLLQRTCELSVEDLRVAVAKDHGYCLRSELGTHHASGLCSLEEHDYCWQHQARKNCEPGAACQRLAQQQSGMAQKARGVLRRYRPLRKSGFPRRGCSGCQTTTQATNPRAQEPRELRRGRSAQQVTSDMQCAPEGILGMEATPPASSRAARARKRTKSLKDSSASRAVGGSMKAQRSQQMSLQDVFRDVLKAVGCILDSMCKKLELQGLSQEKSIWPIVIQIDNVAEIRRSGSPDSREETGIAFPEAQHSIPLRPQGAEEEKLGRGGLGEVRVGMCSLLRTEID